MIQFYSSYIADNMAILEEDEFQHCCKVLRHKVGDEISISNGKGKLARAVITAVKKRTAELELLSQSTVTPKKTKTTLAIAPPKNRARWEWLLEKSVEIGVDEIIPMLTARTERSKINEDRSNKIIRSAALQSLRNFHPQLAPMLKYDKTLNSVSDSTNGFIAHYDINNLLLTTVQKTQESAVIMIGPEGDFTDSELELAQSKGMTEVNISSHRLRTETAALVGVTMLKSLGY